MTRVRRPLPSPASWSAIAASTQVTSGRAPGEKSCHPRLVAGRSHAACVCSFVNSTRFMKHTHPLGSPPDSSPVYRVADFPRWRLLLFARGGLRCSCPPVWCPALSRFCQPWCPVGGCLRLTLRGLLLPGALTGTWASCVISRRLAAFMGCVFSEMPLLVSTDPGACWVPARSSSDRPPCCCSIVRLFKTVTQGWK